MFTMSGMFYNYAYADKVITFEWDANTEADVAGYRLYEKATLADGTVNYIVISEVGNVTEESITVPNLIDKVWVLTCFDTSNNESGKSNEVGKDTIAPNTPTFRIKTTVEVIIQ
jgi:hypothetical protein